MKLLLTIDTEADNQWRTDASLATTNLEHVPRFQALCERFDFPPTYLCTHEVAVSRAFKGTLARWARDGRAEVGAHLHPWSTPPVDDAWDLAGRARTYPSELPDDLLQAKLSTLTTAIGDRLGTPPTSYRAGRWGFSPAQVLALTELGYEVDCSVTPLISWANDRGLRSGGPDFSRAPLAPYTLSRRNVCRSGRSSLLEVPVTIVHTSSAMRRSRALRRWFRRYRRSWPARAGDRFYRLAPQWFRPYPGMTADRLIAVYETANALGVPAVELMLHSSELMPGGSPYNPTAAAVDDLFRRLEATFAHLMAHGAEGITLTGFARSRATVPQTAKGDASDLAIP
jgi:hypothetical protein